MRFAFLAASAAICAFSVPANAAVWTFNVTANFNAHLWQYVTYYDENLGYNWIRTTETIGVFPKTYTVQVNTTDPRNGSGDVATGMTDMAGVSFDYGRSFASTHWQLTNGNILFTSANWGGDYGAHRNCSPGPVGCSQGYGQATATNLSFAFVSSSDATAPLPEPATWAMMIGGFGLVGTSMRYRRRKTTVSFA